MHIVPQNLLGNPGGDYIRDQVFAKRGASGSVGGLSLPEIRALLPHPMRQDKVQAGTNVTIAWNALGPVISASGGSGSGDSVSFAVAQVAHGFSVGHTIQLTASGWATADRDAGDTAADAIVSAVADADNFTATMVGKVTLTTGQWDSRTGDSGGLTQGDYYWLSSTAGGLTKTQPTSGIAQPVGVALSTTVLLVRIGEAIEITAADAELAAIAGLTSAADKLPYFTGSGTAALADFTAAGRALVDDANAAAQRTTLGATTIGSNLFTLTNPSAITFPRYNADNSVSALSASAFRTAIGSTTAGDALYTLANPGAISFLRVNADNSVTARSAANFRTDLSLVPGTDVQAYDAELAAIAGLASAADKGIQFTGSGTAALIGLAHGTYTPTLTNTTNVAASTAYVCTYFRIGDVVHVTGRVDIDPTAGSVATLLGMSLPIASNLGAAADLGGVAAVLGIASVAVAIIADTTNDRASFSWVHSSDTANRGYHFTFTYRVI